MLTQLGYTVVFYQRKGLEEGVALAFKSHKYTVSEFEEIDFDDLTSLYSQRA